MGVVTTSERTKSSTSAGSELPSASVSVTTSAPSAAMLSADINSSGERALRMALTPMLAALAAVTSGARVARPTPRATMTIRRQVGSISKPWPSGPSTSKSSPGSSAAITRVPAPTTL
ncbi:MAG: hypothetical protein CMM08_17135 [Rhodospirillaceae bacterium]|nr:hypothetical protein [Rhodospirillaceae bacterium]